MRRKPTSLKIAWRWLCKGQGGTSLCQEKSWKRRIKTPISRGKNAIENVSKWKKLRRKWDYDAVDLEKTKNDEIWVMQEENWIWHWEGSPPVLSYAWNWLYKGQGESSQGNLHVKIPKICFLILIKLTNRLTDDCAWIKIVPDWILGLNIIHAFQESIAQIPFH